MSSTATRTDRTLDQRAGPAATPLAPPPKLRRRPALDRGSDRRHLPRRAARRLGVDRDDATPRRSSPPDTTIERGAVIEADDLARVRLSADPALSRSPASQLDEVVGQRAALDIAAGGC